MALAPMPAPQRQQQQLVPPPPRRAAECRCRRWSPPARPACQLRRPPGVPRQPHDHTCRCPRPRFRLELQPWRRPQELHRELCFPSWLRPAALHLPLPPAQALAPAACPAPGPADRCRRRRCRPSKSPPPASHQQQPRPAALLFVSLARPLPPCPRPPPPPPPIQIAHRPNHDPATAQSRCRPPPAPPPLLLPPLPPDCRLRPRLLPGPAAAGPRRAPQGPPGARPAWWRKRQLQATWRLWQQLLRRRPGAAGRTQR